jgi:hypothetical protein
VLVALALLLLISLYGAHAEAACPDAAGITLQLGQKKSPFSGESTGATLDKDGGNTCTYVSAGEMTMSTRVVPGSKDCQPNGNDRFACQYGELICPGEAEVRAQYSSYAKDWRSARGERLGTRFKRHERKEDSQGAWLRCIYEPGKAAIERR